MGAATSRVAADATAFGDRNMGFMLSIDGFWKDPADDQKNIDWVRAFWADMKHHSNGRAYLNFAGGVEEGEDFVRTSYGAANYQRLVEIKTRYDPTNLFRLNQNIRPKA
jgi:FAD/FMN-containing dehydrogenase